MFPKSVFSMSAEKRNEQCQIGLWNFTIKTNILMYKRSPKNIWGVNCIIVIWSQSKSNVLVA